MYSMQRFVKLQLAQLTLKNLSSVIPKKLNINRNEIAAIGDAANDIEMLQYAGLAIAMGNATEEVKTLSDRVTDTNENNGVIKAIERIVSEMK